MSFYTALTGLNGAQADISATSNNIANVGTTGFKRSRAEFGDIFATSPLQNASSSIGSGTILKGITQQFTQGNIASSLNALDLAISGQGFFTLKPSVTATQTVYTRNGSFSVNNERYVVDSAGQYLMVYPVNPDGSVTAKDLGSAGPLQLPVTAGDNKATEIINLGVNLPADAEIVPSPENFPDGYEFDPANPDTYTNSTSITIFDDLGNPTIATVYYIKTQNASPEDPTNKYETRLVVNGQIIEPDLVPAVSEAGQQIFIDKFGNQTTEVPLSGYNNENKFSPLYRTDTMNKTVPSQPASLRGDRSAMEFGDEADRIVEIVTDPVYFQATNEAGNSTVTDTYWGRDFLLINVDNSDSPVSVTIRPGLYNPAQLAAEVERAINEAYGDDRQIQLSKATDSNLSIDLIRTVDGVPSLLDEPIEVDLFATSYALPEAIQVSNGSIAGSSVNLTREDFLAHAQLRMNATLDDYLVTNNTTAGTASINSTRHADLNIGSTLFTRALSGELVSFPTTTQVVEIKRDADAGTLVTASTTNTGGTLATSRVVGSPSTTILVGGTWGTDKTVSISLGSTTVSVTAGADAAATAAAIHAAVGATSGFTANYTAGGASVTITSTAYDSTHNLVYTYNSQKKPALSVFDAKVDIASVTGRTGVIKLMVPDGKIGTLTSATSVVLAGNDSTANLPTGFNGTEFAIVSKFDSPANGGDYIEIDIGQTNLSDAQASALASLDIFGGVSAQVEAFFEGSEMGIDGVFQPYSTKKIVVREIGTAASRSAATATNPGAVFSFVSTTNGAVANLELDVFTATTSWVDERNPPIKISYDASGQNLEFSTDRNVLGSAGAGFSTFTVFNNQLTSGSNGIGIPAATNRSEAPIRGGEVLEAEAFVATGRELNADKRFGIKVQYDNDARAFTIASGSTGEAIGANYAVGVTAPQQASNIQIGRRAISSTDGSATANKLLENVLPTEKTIGGGTNFLMGFGTVKKENVAFVAGKGLAAKPAVAAGSSAQIPLATAFRLTSSNDENIFSISVDGVSATIVLPPRTYAGSTLASALQERINQMSDPITGKTIGGVTVRYNPTSNNLTFTTGTTGINSTIKVSGPARFGLDDVPLGIGSVPEIFDLQQAVNERGELLFVDPQGKVTTAQPDDSELVSDYYPLYIKEGELTFDKGGRLISPKNLVGYEEQLEGASITLKVDYSASTQLAQPFGVINISQDGFTAGRLDGLEIDSSGTIRANYTNGDNNPLGKIVIANFNNQNGLKQVGNATYVETAISGPPTVGEAGAEGFGTILSGSLERSNVDITEELVNLITAQRNYQASAKAIETTTSLNQTIINIRQ